MLAAFCTLFESWPNKASASSETSAKPQASAPRQPGALRASQKSHHSTSGCTVFWHNLIVWRGGCPDPSFGYLTTIAAQPKVSYSSSISGSILRPQDTVPAAGLETSTAIVTGVEGSMPWRSSPSRSVRGVPVCAAAAQAAVIPGTISASMPASRAAAGSSAARPKILPPRFQAQNPAALQCLCQNDRVNPVLQSVMGAGVFANKDPFCRRRASSKTSPSTRRSKNRVSLLQSLQCAKRQQVACAGACPHQSK